MAEELKKLLEIRYAVLTKLLTKEKDLADEFHLFIGQLTNSVNIELERLNTIIANITMDICIFGEGVLEKELEFQLLEEEDEEIEWEELDEDIDPA